MSAITRVYGMNGNGNGNGNWNRTRGGRRLPGVAIPAVQSATEFLQLMSKVVQLVLNVRLPGEGIPPTWLRPIAIGSWRHVLPVRPPGLNPPRGHGFPWSTLTPTFTSIVTDTVAWSRSHSATFALEALADFAFEPAGDVMEPGRVQMLDGDSNVLDPLRPLRVDPTAAAIRAHSAIAWFRSRPPGERFEPPGHPLGALFEIAGFVFVPMGPKLPDLAPGDVQFALQVTRRRVPRVAVAPNLVRVPVLIPFAVPRPTVPDFFFPLDAFSLLVVVLDNESPLLPTDCLEPRALFGNFLAGGHLNRDDADVVLGPFTRRGWRRRLLSPDADNQQGQRQRRGAEEPVRRNDGEVHAAWEFGRLTNCRKIPRDASPRFDSANAETRRLAVI
ncbi:MAG: hypothetical protein AB7O66_18030 [Limisphaerales bacterium]